MEKLSDITSGKAYIFYRNCKNQSTPHKARHGQYLVRKLPNCRLKWAEFAHVVLLGMPYRCQDPFEGHSEHSGRCLLNSTHLKTSMSISQAVNADPVTPEANLCLPCKSLGPAEGLDLAHTAGFWRRKQQREACVTQTCFFLGISLPVSSGREKPHAPGTWNKFIAYRRAAVRDSRSLASQSPEVQGSVPEWRGFTLHMSC